MDSSMDAQRRARPTPDVTSTADTVPVRETHRFDVVALERYMARARAGLQGPGHGEPVPGRAVQSDLPPELAGRRVRAAPQAARQAPALRARGGARVPHHHRAGAHPGPGAAHLRALRGRRGDRHRVLHHGVGVGAGHGRPAAARPEPGRSRAHLRLDERRARAAAHGGPQGHRARRLRPARQLLRAPDPPLDDAVPRLGDGAHRGHGAADRLAARARARGGAAHDRPRRFPARQPDRPPDGAAGGGGARLGAVHARQPAGRPGLQLHAVPARAQHPGRRARAPTWPSWACRPRRTTWRPTAGAPGARAFPTGSSTWPSRCSAWPPSPRGSWAA